VGAAEARTPRKSRAHSPTSATRPTKEVPEATGSPPPLFHDTAAPALLRRHHRITPASTSNDSGVPRDHGSAMDIGKVFSSTKS